MRWLCEPQRSSCIVGFPAQIARCFTAKIYLPPPPMETLSADLAAFKLFTEENDSVA